MTHAADCCQREKTCYEQNFQQFRSLNQVMWQVPIIAMTLTGGLWFGIAKLDGMLGFQVLLCIFAGCANIGLAIVLSRVRFVMAQYLHCLKDFYPEGHVSAEGTRWPEKDKTVANAFRCLLLIAALISFLAVGVVYEKSGDRPTGRHVVEVLELDH